IAWSPPSGVAAVASASQEWTRYLEPASSVLGCSVEDRCQPRHLALDERRKRRRPAPALLGDRGPEVDEPRARRLGVERLVERGGERLDDRRRRALGREQCEER